MPINLASNKSLPKQIFRGIETYTVEVLSCFPHSCLEMITNTDCKYQWTQLAKYSEKAFIQTTLKKVALQSGYSPNNLREDIILSATQVFNSNKGSISDKQSQFHCLLMSYVLGTSNVLIEIFNEQITQDIVKETFKDIGSFWVILSFKLGMFFSPNKFDFILKNCGTTIKEAYGDSFEIEVDTDNVNYLTTKVLKCGFHDFFVRNNHPELTRLVCERDNNWEELLKDNRYVTYHRPQTIAEGGKSCDFCFKKRTL